MEQVAMRLAAGNEWNYLGGDDEAKKPLEVVIRAFERPVLCATGEDASGPTGEPVRCAPGQGIRLVGRHFYVQAEGGGRPLISHRGLV